MCHGCGPRKRQKDQKKKKKKKKNFMQLKRLGVPIMAQWVKNLSMRMWVQSLALFSG